MSRWERKYEVLPCVVLCDEMPVLSMVVVVVVVQDDNQPKRKLRSKYAGKANLTSLSEFT